MDRHARFELSDLIVDYDPATLERRDVSLDSVLARLPGPRSARRVARRLAGPDGILDRARVDEVLVRSHLELQRLHEEFRVGVMMRDVGLLGGRALTPGRGPRLERAGCYSPRWAHGGAGTRAAASR